MAVDDRLADYLVHHVCVGAAEDDNLILNDITIDNKNSNTTLDPYFEVFEYNSSHYSFAQWFASMSKDRIQSAAKRQRNLR